MTAPGDLSGVLHHERIHHAIARRQVMLHLRLVELGRNGELLEVLVHQRGHRGHVLVLHWSDPGMDGLGSSLKSLMDRDIVVRG